MITDDNFEIKHLELPELKDGEVRIKTLYLSVDPYMRGRMNVAKSYIEPYELNQPINGRVIGEVISSRSFNLKVGDKVFGILDFGEFVQAVDSELEKISDDDIQPITAFLHVLGMPGMTAYLGFSKIGEPRAQETVVVSGAGGAVGMIVGQLAKIYGCRVIGITGSEHKRTYLLDELGFDAVINYKQTESLEEELRRLAPEGVDIYYDNVGGDISDIVYL